MLKNWNFKIVLILIILLLISCIGGYFIYQKYKEVQIKLSVEKIISLQNKTYADDILKQKSDSINILAGQVVVLNGKIQKITGKYTSQNIALQLKIDSMRVVGDAISATGKDSIGDYIQVKFNGKKNITSFSGFTKHYNKKDIYDISLTYDPISVTSSLFIDTDGIWRLKTISQTPGVFLKVDYAIDSNFFNMYETSILGDIVEENQKEEDHIIGLRLYGGITGSLVQDSWYNQHTFDVNAEFYYKYIYVRYQPLIKVGSLGLFLDMNFTKIYKFIKNIF
jgi:hypothetical protein